MTQDQAKAIARQEIEKLVQGFDVEWCFLDNMTSEEDCGWLFFYESKKFLETDDISDRLLGNSPIVVDRWGRPHHIGTAGPARVLIEALKQQGEFDPPKLGGQS